MALLDARALRDALRVESDREAAPARYAHERRHVDIYRFPSRSLTPLIKSDRDFAARLRDVALLPMGRIPGGRGHMLRVLTGTQQGWLGRRGLAAGFLDALGEVRRQHGSASLVG